MFHLIFSDNVMVLSTSTVNSGTSVHYHPVFPPAPLGFGFGSQTSDSGAAPGDSLPLPATPSRSSLPLPLLHTNLPTSSPPRRSASFSSKSAPSLRCSFPPPPFLPPSALFSHAESRPFSAKQTAHAVSPATLSGTRQISSTTSKGPLHGPNQHDRDMNGRTAENKARLASRTPDSTLSTTSSPISPLNSQRSTPGERPGQRIMPRTSSIDSAISSLSSASQSHKSSFDVSALSQTDIGNLITTAGSAEAVIKHLLKEKHHAASQNSQLWRLVDKQRTLILGLNKDLDRALKDKERYKKKVKDLQNSAPPVPSVEAQTKHDRSTKGREGPGIQGGAGQSQASNYYALTGGTDSGSKIPSTDLHHTIAKQSPQPDFVESRSLADQNGESQTPPSLVFSRQELSTASPSLESPNTAKDSVPGEGSQQRLSHPVRKPPPAPLNLGLPEHRLVDRPDVSDSESEYEDILAVDEQSFERGRRKTRDDDDRERETAVQSEQGTFEFPAGKEKAQATSALETPTGNSVDARMVDSHQYSPRTAPRLEQLEMNSHVAHMSPPGSHAAMMAVKSPGLPMSPRPEDRPLGSPLPRMPGPLATMPISSGGNVSGLALSPRAAQYNNPFASPVPASLSSDSGKGAVPSIDAAVRIDSPRSPAFKTQEIYQGLVSEDYPNLLLSPNALPLVQVKVSSSRLRPSRNSYNMSKPSEEEPVFTLGVFSRADNAELWRVEKVIAALPQLDQQVKQLSAFGARLPDRSIFNGHSPAKVDSRRAALNSYFEALLDSPMDENAALALCQFLTTDAIEPRDDETSLLKGKQQAGSEMLRGPDGKPRKEGYLTKRGKNFGGWKARYFVLHGPELKYFESPGGPHLGTIKIYNAQIGKQSMNANGQNSSPSRAEEDVDNQYRHAFLVLEPKKKDSSALVRHVLCAESDEDRDTWVEALLEYVESQSESESSNPGSSKEQTPIISKQPVSNSATTPNITSNGSRKGNRGLDTAGAESPDTVQGFSYDDAVPAEPPIFGPASEQSPVSPLLAPGGSADFGDVNQVANPSPDPNQLSSRFISRPTNGAVIQDAGAWGNKAANSAKEKKRSIWSFRTRSSIDLASQLHAVHDLPTPQPHGHSLGDKRDFVRPVFGIPLAEAVQFCAPQGVAVNLPAVVYRCIEYLKAKDAASEEGIFRLSGSNVVVKALKERFNTEGDVDFLAGDQYYDVHAVASLFKQYLRELPTTVLTRELHLEFLRVLELDEKQKKLVAFNSLVHRLPKANLTLLRALVQFLINIVNNSDVNKMTVRNVGIVFAPTLNIPAPVFSMFLTNFEDIFEDPPSSGSATAELNASHSISSGDVRSPRRQMFSDIPTPGYGQTAFRKEEPLEDFNTHHDTGFISMQPSYEHSNHKSDLANEDEMYSPSMLTPANETSRSAKAKRRESSMLFMELNHQSSSPPPY
ncbi:GTPase-activating protein BEM3 [Aspergillus affinis]|uniref:GTPase-activating protein BEM3 n=1 Tax=Aspergillus affinis TaxID=1070780 RepID=UPI0022FDE41B|nr:RhoGAP domain protein [Aspergillus affinis]KAI9039066.1 RhoGAP domain protein [Aspergillus affinis]